MSSKATMPFTPANKRLDIVSTDESRSPSPLSPTLASPNSDDDVFTAALSSGAGGVATALFRPIEGTATEQRTSTAVTALPPAPSGGGAAVATGNRGSGVPVIRIPARVAALTNHTPASTGTTSPATSLPLIDNTPPISQSTADASVAGGGGVVGEGVLVASGAVTAAVTMGAGDTVRSEIQL